LRGDVLLHLVRAGDDRVAGAGDRVAVAGVVNVEHRLDGRVEPLDVEGLVDGALGLPERERVHLGDLPGQVHRVVLQPVGVGSAT